MNFNFSDNKGICEGTIQNRKGTFGFEEIDILKPQDNLIEIDGISYYFTYIDGAQAGKSKGGNSIILSLYESQSIDTDNIEYPEPDLILKISKSKKSTNPSFPTKSDKRFLKEIDALKACNEKNFQNVIKIYHSGTCKIKNYRGTNYDEHLYYTMEYAKYDLKNFIENFHEELGLEEKITLCISLCEGLKELFSLNYYHRDIKPDNIFLINNIWKIGDLGLISERNLPDEIDRISERIGPIGWMSPESMNKYLCEGNNFIYNHNCLIDHQSDIFQLGKVFWYIFQHNSPIGSIKGKDFYIKNSKIYPILRTMLNHSKERRYKNIDEVIRLLKMIQTKTLVNAA